MKTLLTLLTITISFILTSCYTQFAAARQDDSYVVERERQYKNYEYREQQEQEQAVVEEEDSAYYEDVAYVEEDAYYADDNLAEVEYHYSSRPYVYLYRFTHYDPWYDEYVYYNRPVTVISVRLAPRYRYYYDPYWAGFYCSPYDYYDPWFGWCGYSYVSYYPYYYGHYYYDRYYGGYYHGYYGRRGHRYHSYRYGRDYYASNWGRRPFTSSGSGRLATRPERPERPDAITRPDRPLDMPSTRPVVSRPDRQKEEAYTLERPVRKSGNEILRTQPAVYTKKALDDDRKYQRKYYNSSDRIKSELQNSRNEVQRTGQKSRSGNVSEDNSTSKPVRKTYKYNNDRREQRKTVEPVDTRRIYKPSPERSRTTNKKYSGERRTNSNTVTKPRSSSRERSNSSKSYVRPRSSGSRESGSSKVRSAPRSSSSSSSSRSTVRSAPSRSSYSGTSGRSSRSSSSSSSSSRSGSSSSGKRPR